MKQTATRSGKDYRRSVPLTWFLARPNYTLFMLRELSSVFVAVVVVLQLYLVYCVGQGPEAYQAALAVFASPLTIAFHVVALGFVALHVVTWFGLNAQIVQVGSGDTAVSPAALKAASWVAWVVVTALLAWVLIG